MSVRWGDKLPGSCIHVVNWSDLIMFLNIYLHNRMGLNRQIECNAPSAQVAQDAPSTQVAQQCSARATQPCHPAPVTQSRSYALPLPLPVPVAEASSTVLAPHTGVTAGLLRTGITKQGSTATAHHSGADWCSGSPCPSIQPSSAVTRRARDDCHWNFIGSWPGIETSCAQCQRHLLYVSGSRHPHDSK